MRKKNNNRTPIEPKPDAEEFVKKKFGQNLKAIREEYDLSQEAMAFIANLSRSYYSEVETGVRNISLINITKIAAALNIEISQLLPLSEIKKKIK